MRPEFSEVEASAIVEEFYGFTGLVNSLPSYSDQNFLVDQACEKFVLKITNSTETFPVLDFQQKALQHVRKHAPQLRLPHVIPASDGSTLNQVPAAKISTSHLIWMVNFLPGRFISDLPGHSPQLLEDLGAFMGTIDNALASFQHAAMHRNSIWDLKNVSQLHTLHHHIKDSNKKSLVAHFLERFEKHTASKTSVLRQSVIHNDANDNNVLVTERNNEPAIDGIIDFGDMLYSYTVGELAIAIAYMILDKEDPLATASHVLKGYHKIYPLQETETEVLFDFVCLRLCTSVCMSARERSLAPDNTYLAISEQPAWEMLARLVQINPNAAAAHFTSVLS